MSNSIINEYKFIELPTLLCLGVDMIKSLPKVIDRLSLGNKAILITDAYLRTRVASEVEDILNDGKKEVYVSVIEDSTMEEVEKQIQVHESVKPDFVIGLGGGKSIDIAKSLAFKTHQKFISVPTIASHDGVASSRASIIGQNKRHSIQAHPPIAVVKKFRELGVKKVAPSHCTGDPVREAFAEEYKEDFIEYGVGKTIEIKNS